MTFHLNQILVRNLLGNILDSDLDKATVFTSSNDIVDDDHIILGDRKKDLDNTYGSRKLTENKLTIGHSPIVFNQNYIYSDDII